MANSASTSSLAIRGAGPLGVCTGGRGQKGGGRPSVTVRLTGGERVSERMDRAARGWCSQLKC